MLVEFEGEELVGVFIAVVYLATLTNKMFLQNGNADQSCRKDSVPFTLSERCYLINVHRIVILPQSQMHKFAIKQALVGDSGKRMDSVWLWRPSSTNASSKPWLQQDEHARVMVSADKPRLSATVCSALRLAA